MAKTTANSSSPSTTHLMMIPHLAFGHIFPFVQLAKKLLLSTPPNTLRITFLSTSSNITRIQPLLPSANSDLDIIPLHLPSIPGLRSDASSTVDLTLAEAELLKVAIDATKPQVHELLLQHKPQFAFFDFSMHWLPELATPLGIKTMFFSIFGTVSTAYLTPPARRLNGLPTLEEVEKPPAGFPPTSAIQSVPRYQAQNFMYMYTCFNGMPCVYDRVVACIQSCSGMVYKTCMEFEGQYVKYVESQYKKPVMLAGPLVPEPPAGDLEKKWADWLDGFEENSVVFCAFGSENFLSDEAIKALLLGLEMTGLPFAVVLNFPKQSKEENNEQGLLKKILPEDFEERVKGRGIVHIGWVNQQHILRHKSVGCFVTHAGLSSIQEGLVAGCQLVFLPYKADQFLNAAIFDRELGIGVEIERNEEDGAFIKESVCNAIKKVMILGDPEYQEQGNVIREKHKKWREFMLDEKVQQRFMLEFVERLEELAAA